MSGQHSNVAEPAPLTPQRDTDILLPGTQVELQHNRPRSWAGYPDWYNERVHPSVHTKQGHKKAMRRVPRRPVAHLRRALLAAVHHADGAVPRVHQLGGGLLLLQALQRGHCGGRGVVALLERRLGREVKRGVVVLRHPGMASRDGLVSASGRETTAGHRMMFHINSRLHRTAITFLSLRR